MKKKNRKITPADPAVVAAKISNVGVAIAALAAADIQTIAEARLYVAVATDETIGKRVSVMNYGKQLGMPLSTISRVSYALVKRNVLSYEDHPTDRRMKLVRADLSRL